MDESWRRRGLLVLYLTVVIAASITCGVARQCNNFAIFRAAYDNLLLGRDLYVLHPEQYDDLYKYTPTFALLFAPFSRGPFAVALLAWNLLNAGVLVYALGRLLPGRKGTQALFLAWIGFALTTDGTQSNALVAGLIVLAYIALEERRLTGFALSAVLGAMVKIFPAVAATFAIARPNRVRVALVLALTAIALVLLPLTVTSPATLVAQYVSWTHMADVDALDRGASVMSLLHDLTGYSGPNWPVQLLGTIVLLAPLARVRSYASEEFRTRFLSSVLAYCVLFNHKAEQPTFIIALAGAVIWWAVAPRSPMRDGLIAFSLALLVPVWLSATFGHWDARIAGMTIPLLRLAAVPLTAMWVVMQVEMLGAPVRTATALNNN